MKSHQHDRRQHPWSESESAFGRVLNRPEYLPVSPEQRDDSYRQITELIRSAATRCFSRNNVPNAELEADDFTQEFLIDLSVHVFPRRAADKFVFPLAYCAFQRKCFKWVRSAAARLPVSLPIDQEDCKVLPSLEEIVHCEELLALERAVMSLSTHLREVIERRITQHATEVAPHFRGTAKGPKLNQQLYRARCQLKAILPADCLEKLRMRRDPAP